MIPDREFIREHFDYRDGALYRKSNGRRGIQCDAGYIRTWIGNRAHGEHRLIHLLFTGEWPAQVDHINGVRDDNRPENLRSATHAQNCMNRKPMGRFSKGCYWQPKRRKWVAQIGFKRKRITIGYFETEAEAAAAYAAKSAELHQQFGRTS